MELHTILLPLIGANNYRCVMNLFFTNCSHRRTTVSRICNPWIFDVVISVPLDCSVHYKVTQNQTEQTSSKFFIVYIYIYSL